MQSVPRAQSDKPKDVFALAIKHRPNLFVDVLVAGGHIAAHKSEADKSDDRF